MDMIEPGGILQYTGDFSALSKAVTELRKRAIGIRDAGKDVHSRFQATAAFYKAPEADQLFSSTQPVMDTADEFAGHIESLGDALDTFVGEAKPYADRLKHLKEKAIAFVDSVEGDDGWTKDQHKVDAHNALMDGVAEAVVGFKKAEHDAAVKIGAISPALCRPVGDEGTYSVSVKTLESMPNLPWGTPVDRSYDRWSLDWWGHGIKSWAWDGLVKDSLWGGFVGLGIFEDNILGINGSDAQHQTWDGLKRTVVGTYAYGMDAVGEGDHLSDWQRGSEENAKEFGKQFIAYDEWHKDPARAHAVTSFNLLTVLGGAGGALAKLGKAGRFAEAASTVAKVGGALDPISGAARAARALSDLPKVSEVLTNVSEHLRLPKTRFPDGALDDLSNRYRVDKDGNFIALKPDGTPDTSPVRNEPPAADRTGSSPSGDRELVGAGARTNGASAHDSAAHAAGADVRTPELAGAHVGGTPPVAAEDAAGGAASHQPNGGTGGSEHGLSMEHEASEPPRFAHGPGGSPTASHSTANDAASHGGSGSGSHTHQPPTRSSSRSGTGGHNSGDTGSSHHGGSGSSQAQGAGNTANPPVGDGYVQQAPHRVPGTHSTVDPKAVDNRIAELDDRQGGEGHAPGRHLHPSDDALRDRLGTVARDDQGQLKIYGPASNYHGLLKSENNIDPLTGTSVDGVHGRVHKVGPFATRFDNAEDMVVADRYFRDEIARTGAPPPPTPIERILGSDGYKRFTGFYRDPAEPDEFLPLDFQGGTIRPVYKFEDGGWKLTTMYADPEVGRYP
ncbi:hypothetical protein BIV25_17040 [Streptomyces sp. MUSC 14]|uniref:hypothetical protein n=1 Tax=Streptomyces sp. MUSC 14 TaxID=1354889 RepID=UPI0008F56D9C|nr:hypothetical protein [Streptomyces sp. MUSC 14]OIJ96665.1 hypothetical protein BIV25_17040 [Streptomyces sp. MUSC 14]